MPHFLALATSRLILVSLNLEKCSSLIITPSMNWTIFLIYFFAFCSNWLSNSNRHLRKQSLNCKTIAPLEFFNKKRGISIINLPFWKRNKGISVPYHFHSFFPQRKSFFDLPTLKHWEWGIKTSQPYSWAAMFRSNTHFLIPTQWKSERK